MMIPTNIQELPPGAEIWDADGWYYARIGDMWYSLHPDGLLFQIGEERPERAWKEGRIITKEEFQRLVNEPRNFLEQPPPMTWNPATWIEHLYFKWKYNREFKQREREAGH